MIDAYEPFHPDGPTDLEDDARSHRPAWVDEERDPDERHPELLVNVRSTIGELQLDVME